MTLRHGAYWCVVLGCVLLFGACSSKSTPDTKVATDEPVAMNDEVPPPENLDMDITGDDTLAAGDGDIPAAPADDLMPGSSAGTYGGTSSSYGSTMPDSRGYPDYSTPRSGGGGGGYAGGSSYTIQRGDTLWGLSRRYGVSVNSLASANNISPNAVLRIGQRLTIPGAGSSGGAVSSGGTGSAGTYRVQRGDTYSGLAKRFGVSTQRLMDLNGATSSNLREGQTIRVP
jgi:LysM repeat protein